jgi:hypothetical protein
MRTSNSPSGKMLAVLLSATLSLVLSLNVAWATDSKKTMSKSTSLTQAYVWYDGDREQQVWLNPQVVAEFSPGAQGESAMKSAHAGARVLPTKHSQAAIRFWQLDNTAETAMRSLKASHPQGNYSAVLHDAPASSARMRALPGNVIVYLDPQWNHAAVNNWLSAHKLEIVKKLEIGPNIYVIKTGPGLEALEIANALYRSGEVKAAFPDWWQEISTR